MVSNHIMSAFTRAGWTKKISVEGTHFCSVIIGRDPTISNDSYLSTGNGFENAYMWNMWEEMRISWWEYGEKVQYYLIWKHLSEASKMCRRAFGKNDIISLKAFPILTCHRHVSAVTIPLRAKHMAVVYEYGFSSFIDVVIVAGTSNNPSELPTVSTVLVLGKPCKYHTHVYMYLWVRLAVACYSTSARGTDIRACYAR